MKLPEGKKERNQVFVLIGLGVVGVLVGLYFAFSTLGEHKEKARKGIEDLQNQIEKADRTIRQIRVDEENGRAVVKSLQEISEKRVLHAVLGNYLLSSRQQMDEWAGKVNVSMDPIRGIGEGDVTLPGVVAKVRGYTARIVLNCGMHDLVRLLHEIETSNPYVSLTGLSIASQAATDKDRQIVSFDLQWPIWADPAKLEEQLRHMEESVADPVAPVADAKSKEVKTP